MEKHTCEICWDEVEESELFSTNCSPVSHKFHIECIKLNYNTFKNKECPMCRKHLSINIKNLYPKCKFILTQGKNKGKNCSKNGKHEGYCEQHKTKIEMEQNNPEESGVILLNPKNVLTVNCEAITKKGTNCKNKGKFNIEFNGKIIHVCGIHKNYKPIEDSSSSLNDVIPEPILNDAIPAPITVT